MSWRMPMACRAIRVQQALLLLKTRGLVREAPGRGLIVPPARCRIRPQPL